MLLLSLPVPGYDQNGNPRPPGPVTVPFTVPLAGTVTVTGPSTVTVRDTTGSVVGTPGPAVVFAGSAGRVYVATVDTGTGTVTVTVPSAPVVAPSGLSSASLQQLLDAGSVQLAPNGTYVLDSPLTIPPGHQLFLNGATLTATAAVSASVVAGAANEVHTDSAVLGPGTIDASAVTSPDCTAVIDFSGATSCPGLRIAEVTIVAAPVHGIYVSETTYTQSKKWITNNSVLGHGIVATGYGIYADYIGSVDIDNNYVESTNADDGIELGHSGDAYLGVNAHLRATNNTVVGGQIQFPFSDHVEILANTVLGNTILNDTNTAEYAIISNNVILGATPASGYAGIRVVGDKALITGNQVQVTTGNGVMIIGTQGTISDNVIYSLATTHTGTAIDTSNSAQVQSNLCTGVNGGGFTTGIATAGSFSAVEGNTIITFNGIDDSSEYSLFSGNVMNVDNLGVVSLGSTCKATNNHGYNPVGVLTAPAVPSSGTAVTNTFGVDATVYVTGGTVTAIAVNGTDTGMISGPVRVAAGQTITLTYSAAPTWTWFGD